MSLVSCYQKNSSAEKNIITADSVTNVKSDSTLIKTKNLIGEWGIYETVSDGVITKCNVCPEINFNTDYTATIIKPSREKENLKWKIDDKTIAFINSDKNIATRTFSDTSYMIIFTRKKEFMELELMQKDKKYSYLLRR